MRALDVNLIRTGGRVALPRDRMMTDDDFVLRIR
jgi:hypothetical protein